MPKTECHKRNFPYLCQRNENKTPLHTEQHDEDCCRSLLASSHRKINYLKHKKEKLWEQLSKESSEDSQEK